VRYVVTGAAGFVGSHLTESLLASGHTVVPVDSFTDYYDVALKEENARAFEVVRADLAEADLDALLAGADGVFHLAGQPGVRGSWGEGFALYAQRNVVATHRVFEAAARAGTRVVFASSSSIYGDAETYPTPEDIEPKPVAAYGITKLACEHLARAYAGTIGLDAVALRYFTVYGPRQRPDMAFRRLVDALADGGTFTLFGDGSRSRSFTYVADVVAATELAMERAEPGAVYNVGGGEEATMAEVISLLERIAGRTLELERRPDAPGDMRRTLADTTLIHESLGWSPDTGLAQGLGATWSWASGRRVSGR
jgi:UDP-glucuronate 4-epimerase